MQIGKTRPVIVVRTGKKESIKKKKIVQIIGTLEVEGKQKRIVVDRVVVLTKSINKAEYQIILGQ